jgi:hypothetical protein
VRLVAVGTPDLYSTQKRVWRQAQWLRHPTVSSRTTIAVNVSPATLTNTVERVRTWSSGDFSERQGHQQPCRRMCQMVFELFAFPQQAKVLLSTSEVIFDHRGNITGARTL